MRIRQWWRRKPLLRRTNNFPQTQHRWHNTTFFHHQIQFQSTNRTMTQLYHLSQSTDVQPSWIMEPVATCLVNVMLSILCDPLLQLKLVFHWRVVRYGWGWEDRWLQATFCSRMFFTQIVLWETSFPLVNDATRGIQPYFIETMVTSSTQTAMLWFKWHTIAAPIDYGIWSSLISP